MPPENDPNTQQPPATTTTSAPAATPPADPPAQQAAPVDQPAGKTTTIPTAQIGKWKREAADKAARALAKQMGFDSVDEMLASKNRKPAAPAKPAQTTTPAPTQTNTQQASGMNLKQQRDYDERLRKMAREKATSERRRREADNARLRAEALTELTQIAMECGITNVKFALHLMQEATSGLDEASLRKFDERAFFTGLRKDHPYIFNERVVPANTSVPAPGGAVNPANAQRPGGNTAPPAPAKPLTNGQPVNAMKMTRQEFQEHLRKQGFSVS